MMNKQEQAQALLEVYDTTRKISEFEQAIALVKEKIEPLAFNHVKLNKGQTAYIQEKLTAILNDWRIIKDE